MKKPIVLLVACMMAATVSYSQFLTTINPDSANAGQSLTVSVFGSGTSFTQGSGVMNVRLVLPPDPAINASSWTTISNTQVDPSFTIPPGTKSGWYDMEVSTDVDGLLIKPQGFYITGPSIASLSPNNANAGQALTVSITGALTNFFQGSQVFSVWLSQGSSTITAATWTVITNTTMTADFTLPLNSGGYYDFNISDDVDGQVVDKLGFYINGPRIKSADPDTVDKGPPLAVTVYGGNTTFLQGSGVMNVELRQGPVIIPALPYTVVNDSVINCTFSIDPFKPTGFYDIIVVDDGGTKTKVNGFYVNPPQLTTISPNVSARNQTLTVAITGQSTFFQAGSGTFNVWLDKGPSVINALPYTVNNDLSISADFTIGSTAEIGFWDVLVSDDADGTVKKVAGFEVICVNLSLSTINPNCFGGCDGVASASVSGGTSPYTYSWNTVPIQTNATATGLCDGTYTVTVQDFTNTCSNSGVVTLASPPNLVVTGVITNPSCNGGCDGTIDLTVTGGTIPYTYLWDSGNIFEDETNICAGTHIVTVTDANGCTDISSYSVADPPAITANAGLDGSVCANNATFTLLGSVTVATGGAWSTSGSGTFADPFALLTTYSPSAADIAAGTVTLSLTTTGNGPCAAVVDNMVLTITPAPTASAGPDQSVCANNSLVSLSGSVTVATGGNWTTSGSGTFFDATSLITTYTPSALDIVAGTVTLTLTTTGNGNCNAELDNMTVTITNAPTVSAGADQTVCANTALVSLAGSVTVASGGTWTTSGTGTFADANALTTTYMPSGADISANTVTLALTSTGNGTCNAVSDTMVVTINLIPVLSTSTNDATCGGSDGDATVAVTGVPPPHTYLWDDSGAQTTATATGLPSGLYMVIVTAFGCLDTAFATVSDAGGPVATTISSDETCGSSNGTASVSVTGGTPPFVYSWDDPSTQTNATATGLVPNLYTVTVTDSLGCSAVDAVTVNGIGSPTISITNIVDVSCFAGNDATATGIATGGGPPYTYSWNTSPVQTDTIATGLVAGSYTITVLDTNGCSANATANVIEPNILAVSATGVDPSCAGVDDGTATASGSGGTGAYTYSWDDPNSQTTVTATGLAPNSYIVTIEDANGCTNTGAVTISPAAAAMTLMITEFDETNCQSNGIVLLTVSGGTTPYLYLWSNGATTEDLNGLSVGSYIVTVTDSVGCTATDTATINGSQPPATSIVGSDESTCNGGDGIAVLTLTGGTSPFTYNWSNAATTQNISGLVGGTYTVQVTDANSCMAFDTVIIGQPESPSVSVTGFDESSCSANDGVAAAVVSGGTPSYTYSWSNGGSTQNVTGLAPGTYIITVTDANNCTGSDAININAAPGPSIEGITGIDESSCGQADGAAVSTVSGGATPYTYSWSSGATAANATGLSAGTHVLTVTDANGCMAIDSVELAELGSIVLSLSITDANCGSADGSATVTVTGGTTPYTYTWSSGDSTALADSLSAGIYIITVVDTSGCSNSAAATISDVGGATVDNVTITDATCNGGSDGAIDIDVSGGIAPYTFSWSNGSSSEDISGIGAGPYEINIVDGNGCITSASNTVAQPNALALVVSSVDANCGSSDGEAAVSTSGGTLQYTFSWNTAPPQTDSMATGLTAGVYTVVVTDGNGCMDSVSSAVSNIGGPTITVDLIEDADCGSSVGSIYVSISGGNTPYTYSWSNGSTDEDLVGVSAGSYDLTVEDSVACIATASLGISGVPPTFESICMVTVDSITGMNLIVWEEIQTAGVASYNIYKESTQLDVYYLIGNVPIDSTSEFVDSVSDPAIRSWRYKIAVIDSCGNESSLSDDHKTMHLTINLGLNNSINLIWDHYEGYTFGSYYIERYTTATNWVSIDSMASNLTSRTDPSPPTGNLMYRVYSKHPNGCTADKKAKNYNSSKSNTTSVSIAGISATATATNATLGNCDGTATASPADGDAPYTYVWDDPDTQTNAVATGLCPGPYSVFITDANGDTVTASTTVIEDTAPGFDEISLKDQIELFPNPSRGQFMLTVDNGLENAEIVIYNLIGEAVYTLSEIRITSKMQIDLGGHPAGVYYLKLVTESGFAVKKVIIE